MSCLQQEGAVEMKCWTLLGRKYHGVTQSTGDQTQDPEGQQEPSIPLSHVRSNQSR